MKKLALLTLLLSFSCMLYGNEVNTKSDTHAKKSSYKRIDPSTEGLEKAFFWFAKFCVGACLCPASLGAGTMGLIVSVICMSPECAIASTAVSASTFSIGAYLLYDCLKDIIKFRDEAPSTERPNTESVKDRYLSALHQLHSARPELFSAHPVDKQEADLSV